MRAITYLTTWAVLLPTFAQQTAPDDRLADLPSVAPHERVPATMHWSGAGGRFGPGQMIDPMPLRAIIWEFGDGGLGSILAPQPWRPEEGGLEHPLSDAPWSEHVGGSPCVSASADHRVEERSGDPRPYIVPNSGRTLLVTTGMGGRHLAVHIGDGVRTSSELASRRFASGRWELTGTDGVGRDGPLFITLVDPSTGERWYAGVMEP